MEGNEKIRKTKDRALFILITKCMGEIVRMS